jgi:hypothetical protein
MGFHVFSVRFTFQVTGFLQGALGVGDQLSAYGFRRFKCLVGDILAGVLSFAFRALRGRQRVIAVRLTNLGLDPWT